MTTVQPRRAWLLRAAMVAGGVGLAAVAVASAATGDDRPPATVAPVTVGEPTADAIATALPAEGTPPAALVYVTDAESEEGAIEAPPDAAKPPPDRHAAAKNGRFALPLDNWSTFTDRYGAPRGRNLVHGGIDLSLEEFPHSRILSACVGKVAKAAYSGAYGNHVIVDCGDGWSTLYGHLSRVDVAEGTAVDFDTVLGLSGSTGFSTGEHLHFEIRWEGSPVNPEDYLDFNIPEGAPLSNGPIWFPGMPGGGRVRQAPTPRPATSDADGGTVATRPTATPTVARPTPTPTPLPATATPYRVTTSTPRAVEVPTTRPR